MRRGVLRVYLGAAPGVGKTYAMLDEGYRRHERGADVVVGYVETHDRPKTIAQLRDLEVVPRRPITYRDATIEEMDLDAVLARKPQVALVDELAHTNVPGARHPKRWMDVEALLEAGIDVISTVNIQHLESLNDVVEKITGVRQRETVPDAVVRSADQIELVDMSPEALRRRMAHGNIYPAERIDAALANYFREGNLGALRELALLWAADRVEDALDQYRQQHGITELWETRERVVVAITGAPGGEALVRRAARIAGRHRGQLIGVHVSSADGLRSPSDPATLAHHRELVVQLGGTYHDIAGDDVARTLAEFARAEDATQLVLGASARSRLSELVRGSVIADTIRRAAGIDVHVIANQTAAPTAPVLPHQPAIGAVPTRRRVAGLCLLATVLPLLTWLLVARREHLTLATDLLLYLLVVVASGAIGGVVPAMIGAIAGSLLANYFLVEPVHTFTIAERENVIGLAVFLAVAGIVSAYVHLAAQRAIDARRAAAEAASLAWSSATLAGAADPLPLLVEQLRTTLGLEAVAVLQRGGDHAAWIVAGAAGPVITHPTDGQAVPLRADGSAQLVVRGGRLSSDDQRVLRSHADQLAAALTARALQGDAARAAVLEEADAVRTALLQAVSHDLRTPLAGIKAAATSLLSTDVAWDEDTRHEFLVTIDEEADRLNRLVGNLLDMGRLQAGRLQLNIRAVGVEDVVANALGSLSSLPRRIEVAVPDDLALVAVDPALLERALANVIANAITWSPPDAAVRVEAGAVGDRVHVRVVDRGPGIPPEQRAQVLQPFQRLRDDGSSGGVGLGLAVASGFMAAVGGELVLDDTPGGGLTVDLAVPVHRGER